MNKTSTILADEAAQFLADNPTVTHIDTMFADISGIVRGKRLPAGDLVSFYENGARLAGSICFPSVRGETQDPEGLGFSDGDPDVIARPIPGSLTMTPWGANQTAQALVSLTDIDGVPYAMAPRNVLRRVLNRLGDAGLTAVVAFELEFYLVSQGEDGAPRPPRGPISGRQADGVQVLSMASLDEFNEFILAVQSACTAQGLRTGAVTSEYAPGQFEINLHHQADALAAADSCILFRRTVACLARRHGLIATFMAKPYPDHAGSGQHMHISLLDDEGKNVFASPEGKPDKVLRHAIAGILDTLPEAMAMLAPNTNAYRRYAPNLYVPVNPSWGYDNRSVALRIPGGSSDNRRIEHRVASADANPYLCLATALGGILHGFEQAVDPPPEATGNVCDAVDTGWPMRFDEALKVMRNGPLLSDHLGADYVRLYTACKKLELDTFEREINPLEYVWLLSPE